MELEEVRIFKPCKSSMQSGKGKVRRWFLAFGPRGRLTDPLVGWTASQDTRHQLRLGFPNLEAAVEYAKKRGWRYTVQKPEVTASFPKSYGDNFTSGRIR